MTEALPRECPPAEMLAAFLEGKLNAEERAEIARHLETCSECVSLLREAGAFEREEGVGAGGEVVPMRSGWAGGRWWAVAAALVLLVGIGAIVSSQRRDRDAVARMIAAVGSDHHIEARVSHGFAPPASGVMRGGSDENVQLLAEIARLRGNQDGSSEKHALALGEMFRGRNDAAVDSLRELAATSKSADYWNDLSAAYLNRAAFSGNPGDYRLALNAASTAVHLTPDRPEPQFNKALALTRLGLRDDAIEAWTRYLQLDGTSEWSSHARRFLQEVTAKSPLKSWKEERKGLEQAFASRDERKAKEIITRFPRASLDLLERDLLPRWAEAATRSDAEARMASRFAINATASALIGLGELWLTELPPAIESDDADLATALLMLSAGQKALSDGAASRSIDLLRAASIELRAEVPALALIADTRLASACHLANRYGEVETSISRWMTIPLGPVAEARLHWLLGLSYTARGEISAGITEYREALQLLEILGDPSVAQVHLLLAEALDFAGNLDASWAHRFTSLTSSDGSNEIWTIADAAAAAASQGENGNALFFSAKLLRVEDPFALSDAHISKALALRVLDPTRANEELALAWRYASQIVDVDARMKAQVNVILAEGRVSDESKADSIDRAVRFAETTGNDYVLANVLYRRAISLRRTGDTGRSEADLRRAIAAIEMQRKSIYEIDLRRGFLDRRSEVFGELISLLIEKARFVEALSVYEVQRGRELMDSLSQRHVRHLQPLEAERIVKRTPRGVCLAVYGVTDTEILIWSVRNDGVAFTKETYDLKALRRTVRAAHEDKAIAKSLYDILIKPLDLLPAERLLIVPDGPLNNLSFAALIGESDQYLVQDRLVTAAPSASIAVAATGERNRSIKQEHALIVANARSHPNFSDLPNLHYAEEEGRTVASMYRSSEILAGEAATNAAFSASSERASLIHIAAHALGPPRVASASIVLASHGSSRGLLSQKAIARLNLSKVKLVVLSACGSMRSRRESEAIDTIASAFLEAGADAVVGALWDVPDQSSQVLFAAFYRNHAELGMAPAQSLREAQLMMIQTRDSVFSASSGWAAFQYLGTL